MSAMNEKLNARYRAPPPRRWRVPFRNLTRAILLAALLVIGLLLLSEGIPKAVPALGIPTKHWPGWDNINHVVFFGDSYTSITFIYEAGQPTRENPFGNPAWPADAVTRRPVWADFLVGMYNRSFVDAIDLAWGGATVDRDIVPQFAEGIISMKMQIEEKFVTKYAMSPTWFPWKSRDTLFVFWVGINDINKVWLWENGTEAIDVDMAQYANLVDRVYQLGARNFLFLNVPPVDRAPESNFFTPEYVEKKKNFISLWNSKVANLAANLSSTYSESTVFQFDAHKAYTEVLNDPCSHPETCGIQVVNDFCPVYASVWDQKILKSWDFSHEECKWPLNQYFWVDQLHHTYRMHNVTARGVFQTLNATGNNMFTNPNLQ